MITDVENIILNKEYYELSKEELSAVNDLVSNAEEYEEMKWFLASTQTTLAHQKIEATPELKERVMEHLSQEKGKRMFWLNGVGIFLWPTDKEVFRRPAFQMSLAAILLIGFLMVYNKDITPEGNMALNEQEITEPIDGEFSDSLEGKDTGQKNTESGESKEIEEKTGDLSGGNQPSFTQVSEDVDEVVESEAFAEDVSVEVVDEVEEEVDLTHDGWYQPATEEDNGNTLRGSSDEDKRNNMSNANNNELANTRTEALNKEQKADKDFDDKEKLVLNETQTVSKKERLKNGKSKKESVNQEYRDNFDYKVADVISSDASLADSTAITTSDNQPTGGATTGSDQGAQLQNPHNMGVYNTATVDGNFGTNESNEYFPSQMGISTTKELRSLFTTFK